MNDTNAAPEQQPEEQVEEQAAEQQPDQQTAALETRVKALEAQASEARDRMLRALAEGENIRKRAEKERQDISKFAVSSLARDLLGVADNLRRALDAAVNAEKTPALQGILTGVEATERELLRVLESNGVRKIDALGQKFDPNLHEVLFEAEVADKAPGTVMQVVDQGYTIHDRLLRPARVGVAKGGAASGGVDQEV